MSIGRKLRDEKGGEEEGNGAAGSTATFKITTHNPGKSR
jgi:hypothetical protein